MNMESRLRHTGLIVAGGLAIELLSLLPLHALAFIGFVGLGVPIIAAGVLYFLIGLATHTGGPNP